MENNQLESHAPISAMHRHHSALDNMTFHLLKKYTNNIAVLSMCSRMMQVENKPTSSIIAQMQIDALTEKMIRRLLHIEHIE